MKANPSQTRRLATARCALFPFHEPECGAGFPACRFTGLSSPVDQKQANRKSPEPAGWKACATSRSRFMVLMHAHKRKAALHEPHEFRKAAPIENGGEPPHSKTLERWPQSSALPPGL